MNTSSYDAWIANLPDDQRTLVQLIMARVGKLLDSRYAAILDDIQRIERRQATKADRIADLNIRLDVYEERQWTAAHEAIAAFVASQLPPEQRDALDQLLYQLAAEVAQLKAQAVNGDATK